jgi:hypothetical protein
MCRSQVGRTLEVLRLCVDSPVGQVGLRTTSLHRLDHCVLLTIAITVSSSPSLSLCLSHCVLLTIALTVSLPLCGSHRLPHRISHCVPFHRGRWGDT